MASSAEYTWIILFCLVGIVCAISNGLVCCIIVKRRTIIGALNYLVLSLAVTDILIDILCVPMFVSLQITYNPNLQMSSMWNASSPSANDTTTVITSSPNRWAVYVSLNALEVYLSSCSIFNLCIMALDRAILVTKPIFHRGKWASNAVRLKMSVVPWLLALITASFTLIHYTLPGVLANVVAILGALIILPCVFLVVCYTIIFVSIRRRNRRFSTKRQRKKPRDFSYKFSSSHAERSVGMSSASADEAPNPESNCPVLEAQSTLSNVRKINEMKMIRTLLCIIMVFMVCWVPLIVMNIIFPDYSTLKGLSSDFTTTLGTAAKFFHYCNSACNPFIYSFFNPAFRARVVSILRSRSSTQRSTSH